MRLACCALGVSFSSACTPRTVQIILNITNHFFIRGAKVRKKSELTKHQPTFFNLKRSLCRLNRLPEGILRFTIATVNARARLYDQEKRRYLSSGTPRRVRQTFEDWLYDVCNGSPCMDDINAYVTEKLVHMFEKGVFDSKVEHIQRATRYPAEFDFSLLDDDHKLKKSIHKHYSELRKLVDYCDGFLVVNPVKVGRHFYTNRKEENARGHRNAFLKYMHKITLAQEERRKLLEAEATRKEDSEDVLNYFAPAKNLKVLLTEEWFGMLTADEKRFTTKWLHGFVDALMASEWRDQIASDWAVADKRLGLKCMIIGLLKDAGVIRGSYNSIAKLLDMDNENPATLAKYMGMGKKQPYAEWIADYVKG